MLDNSIQNPKSAEQQNVSATSNVPVLIQPTSKSKKQTKKGLMSVNAMEMRRNNGNKTR